MAATLPSRVAITGPRAAGFASAEPMAITVVVADRDRASIENRLAEIAAAASEAVPSVQHNISILSPEQWSDQQDYETPIAHHNIWLAPDTTQRDLTKVRKTSRDVHRP